jgi:hypothetical protein
MTGDYLESGAMVSECGAYRYTLWRLWDASRPSAGWLMVNPSTADDMADDATVRRCVGFAKAWGLGGITVRNLFALRATDPRALLAHPDPVGPENDAVLFDAPGRPEVWNDRVAVVVAGWGSKPGALGRLIAARAEKVLSGMDGLGGRLSYLRLGADGQPSHPLMLPAALKPTPWLWEPAPL